MTETINVLLVEDVETDAKLVLLTLHARWPALRSRRVEDEAAMRAALASDVWDVILCDWSLPNFGAFDALRVLRELQLEIPFVIVSGTIGEELAVEAMREGASDYLLKDKLGRLAAVVEREVREAKVRRDAFEIARIGTWAKDLKANGEMLLSPQAGRIFGLVSTSHILPHPQDRERILQAERDAVEGHQPLDVELRIHSDDGELRWMHLRAVVERDAHDVPTRIFGTAQDVSENRFATEALRRSQALSRIAGEAAHLGGWSLSLPDLRIEWSDEVFAIHEVDAGTPPSLENAINFYAPESRGVIQEKVGACLRDGVPFDLELQILTAKGRRVWVRVVGNADRNASGAIQAIHGAFQNIDDRRLLQEQFRQSQKMEAVGRLAGGVAHDFNNLLSVMLTYSEFALENLKPDDPLASDIKEIQKAAERAAALTRQLLAFSRQQVLSPRVIDLNAIVGAMTPMLARLLGEDVTLTFLPAAALGRVRADPAQIDQLVMNLAVNARDAMPTGGKLTIESSNIHVDEEVIVEHSEGLPKGDYVLLAVADTGTGMDEATRSRVFEPFFTTKEVGKGTGLGLATVFGIVKQSGGYVRVYSEVGQGTMFKVYLPTTALLPESKASDSQSLAAAGSETILLVEDEDQVRTVAAAILRRQGYKVLDTSNGGEALSVSNDYKDHIDLLLTDVVMPRVSGRRLAEQLAPLRPDMKVLFVSGYTDDAIIHHGVLEEGVAFLQKPFTPRALLRKVRDVLDAERPAPVAPPTT